MRAFVTGGGGYVGSSLCSKLVERGYTVTAFDLRYPEEDEADNIHRIKVCTSFVNTKLFQFSP
jgi:nucleoside-diphosphate-sugar epimerase